jgi:hypothetical protein
MSKQIAHPETSVNLYCSEASRQTGEQLFGTATRVDVWLLLEYTGPWGRDALEASDLAKPVKNRVSELLSTLPDSRLQFIKRGEPSNGITFFIGVSQEQRTVLYEFHLEAYEDLIPLDVPAVVRGEPTYDANLRDEPLFLVCTNGKRDRCCARSGFPVYQAMAACVGRDVWQTTHLGGHRFAATGVVLPHGACYGRITETDAQRLVDEYREGRIILERYRGRSCYEKHVQAAEHALRQKTGIMELAHFQLADTQMLGEDEWGVAFTAPDGVVHNLQIRRRLTDQQRVESCTAEQPTRVARYDVTAYRVNQGR